MMTKNSKENILLKLKSLKTLSDTGKEQRIKRAYKDVYYAVKTYFPHHISENETSSFRKEYYKNINTNLKKYNKQSYEAYRGAAKTTLVSRLTTLILTAIKQEKRHVVIISSTLDVAKESLDFIKMELEENERLISDFDIKQGDVWSSEEIVFIANGVKIRIKIYGAGKKIRGANWLGIRPDLIICDDIENDENVESKAQREKLYKWFIKAIMKLPARQNDSYNIIVVGTKLHHDGFLSRLQKRADFKNYSYPLVKKFPYNLDELDKFNISLKDVKDMIIDDNSLNKVELIKEYLEDKESFMSEFQNQPLSKEGTSFSDYETFEEMPLCQSYTIGIDPALGKAKGDYFAISILGSLDDKFYAITKMYKIKATLMIDKIIQTYLQYYKYNKPIKIAIETVQFQEFFKDVLNDRSKSIGLNLPIVELKNTVNKELRIDGISPLVNNQSILIYKKSHLLIDELDTYPKSSHDDGLDSLEMAYRIAKRPAFDYNQALKYLKRKEARNKIINQMLNK